MAESKSRSIKKVVRIVRLGEPNRDADYWRTLPYTTRLAALEEIRQEYHRRTSEKDVMPTRLSPILTELKERLADLLGDELESIYLYGSQARGEPREDSDIDILIVIKGNFDYWKLLKKTSNLVAELSLQNDIVLSRAFVSKADFERGSSPFLMNVRREAVPV